MSEVLWMNIPLMVLFLALWTGIPLYLVLRRRGWHDKPEAQTVPAYLAARRTARTRADLTRTAPRNGRITPRPLHSANG